MPLAREVAARLALLRAQHRSLLQLAAGRAAGGGQPHQWAPIATTATTTATARSVGGGARHLSSLSSSSSILDHSAPQASPWSTGGAASRAAEPAATTSSAGCRPYSTAAAATTATTPTTPSAAALAGVLRPHSSAPRPLPRMRRLRDGFTWRRMVVRVPPEVSVELVEEEEEQEEQGGGGSSVAAACSRRRLLALTGRAGRLELDLAHLDPTGLVAMQLWQRGPAAAADSSAGGNGALLLCVSPDRRCFRGIATHVDNAVRGVTQGYLQGVTVKGVGYRLEPYFEDEVVAGGAGAAALSSKRRLFWEPPPALEGSGGGPGGSGGGGGGGGKTARSAGIAAGPTVTYPVTRPATAVRMKVGFKAAAVVRLPPGVRAFFVRPTLAYLYGADRAAVGNAAASLRAVRPPNAYTGNGVQLVGEEIKLRQRAGAK